MPHPYGFDRLDPKELDLLIQLVANEESGSEAGQQAVAAVIGNRLRSGNYGTSVSQIIKAPGQFEPMARGLKPLDPLQYQRTRMAILGMQEDPTGGATSFYSPKAQAALGRDAPTWARGRQGLDIGGNRFIGGSKTNDSVQQASPVVNAPTFVPVLSGSTVNSVPIPLPPPRPAAVDVTSTNSVPLPPPRYGAPGPAPTGSGPLDAALSKVSPALRENFMRMLATAPPDIRTAISINSGLRTIDRQRELFQKKLQETGGDVAAARRMVAPPGHSQHERGNALDLGYASPAAKTWTHQNAANFGLNFPMSYEDWHIEPAGVRGPPKVLPPEAGGPPAGQPTPTPRVTELGTAAPAATNVPNFVPQRPGPSIVDSLISSLGGAGEAIAGLGGGGGGGGGGGQSVSAGIEGSGYDEELGRLGAQALKAPLPFDNLQGIGAVQPTKFGFLSPTQIGTPKGVGTQSALLKKIMAGL